MQERLQTELKDAQLARNRIKTQALKSLKAAFENERIELGRELDEQEQVKVVQREIKKRKEAAEMYSNADRSEQAAVEQEEIEVLMEFLPEQLEEDEIIEIVQAAIDETNATSVSEMGSVMAVVSPKLTGKADMKSVAMIVKDLLRA